MFKGGWRVRPVGSCKSGVSPELPRIFAVPGERRIVGCLLGRTGIPQLRGGRVARPQTRVTALK